MTFRLRYHDYWVDEGLESELKTHEYIHLRGELCARGYGEEIDWAETVQAPVDAQAFALEYVWVVLNSGMKNQVAQSIMEKVRPTILAGGSATSVFRHPGKSRAIDLVWRKREHFFQQYLEAKDKLAFCLSLPWIGLVTQYHLAKNYGADVSKPDRHLVRIAAASGETPESLCQRLSNVTGDRIATVDLVIWRSANLGLVKVKGSGVSLA